MSLNIFTDIGDWFVNFFKSIGSFFVYITTPLINWFNEVTEPVRNFLIDNSRNPFLWVGIILVGLIVFEIVYKLLHRD